MNFPATGTSKVIGKLHFNNTNNNTNNNNNNNSNMSKLTYMPGKILLRNPENK